MAQSPGDSRDPQRIRSRISAASRTNPGHFVVKSPALRAFSYSSGLLRLYPRSSVQLTDPFRAVNSWINSRTSARVFSVAPSSPVCVFPYFSPMTRIDPDTAPQMLPVFDTPAPNPQAILLRIHQPVRDLLRMRKILLMSR